jgi:hypothetical protein
MLIPPTTLSLLCLLLEFRDTYAIRMEGRRRNNDQLLRRSSAKFAGSYGTAVVGNIQDVAYNINMTIGGESRTVSIDTGRFVAPYLVCRVCLVLKLRSSDLWTIGNVDFYEETGYSGDIDYAQGSASGKLIISSL